MNNTSLSLADYGWSSHFQSQPDPKELGTTAPVRVLAAHRGTIEVAGPSFIGSLSTHMLEESDDEGRTTVGDWLLLDQQTHRPLRCLERHSLFKRREPGTGRSIQLIAANVDTLFIVSSCNQDFNLARLERFLTLARDAEVHPIVILTKADLADDLSFYMAETARLLPGLLVECLDARSRTDVARLKPWCGHGQTVALLGSSGVGKSTLANTLLEDNVQATRDVRGDDAKGRHTTTGRSLHRLSAGGWLLDTPGMRELQLTDSEHGLEGVFADIVNLAAECRFNDCCHQSEPGCAVLMAIERGDLDQNRLRRYQKLIAENETNRASLAERRSRDRAFGKMVKGTMKGKRLRQEIWTKTEGE
ncbi:MAG: ribosome small subunit-dependent GTPase A [Pseudomonadota bacterium]